LRNRCAAVMGWAERREERVYVREAGGSRNSRAPSSTAEDCLSGSNNKNQRRYPVTSAKRLADTGCLMGVVPFFRNSALPVDLTAVFHSENANGLLGKVYMIDDAEGAGTV